MLVGLQTGQHQIWNLVGDGSNRKSSYMCPHLLVQASRNTVVKVTQNHEQEQNRGLPFGTLIIAAHYLWKLLQIRKEGKKYQSEGHKFARLGPVRSTREYAMPLKPVSGGKLS